MKSYTVLYDILKIKKIDFKFYLKNCNTSKYTDCGSTKKCNRTKSFQIFYTLEKRRSKRTDGGRERAQGVLALIMILVVRSLAFLEINCFDESCK